MPEPILRYVVTEHAARQMARRGIAQELLASVLARPEQREQVRPGRDVLQSRAVMGAKQYLVRVFVDFEPDPPEVVSVYRTSRIGKYWRPQP